MGVIDSAGSAECFIYHLLPGKEEEYDSHHEHVWPEVIEQLRAAEVMDYSIFRRGDLVISVVRRGDGAAGRVDARVRERVAEWHALMAPLFRTAADESGSPLFATQIFDISEAQYTSAGTEATA